VKNEYLLAALAPDLTRAALRGFQQRLAQMCLFGIASLKHLENGGMAIRRKFKKTRAWYLAACLRKLGGSPFQLRRDLWTGA